MKGAVVRDSVTVAKTTVLKDFFICLLIIYANFSA